MRYWSDVTGRLGPDLDQLGDYQVKTGIIAATAFVASLVAATAAGAVTFTLTGGSDHMLPSNYNPTPGTPGLAPGATVKKNATLGLTGPGRVTVTYGGTEAGYTNAFMLGGTTLFDNKSGPQASVTADFGAGALPFAFTTKQPAGSFANGETQGYYGSIALFALSDTSYYALFNDSSRSDKDYDDMWVKMDVAPVPLPAAAWLLLGGIGALGAASRRKRTA